ncbi:bifunctional riboflavin kinase/FAD synthetase [Thalassoglobus polymorphus]|uniref:Riboflavin biosynthesis protein n=1 Tax=Thalassoglobus polymorphus TaxID=2527994 RepID=A0A517QLT1_9PLAN|nr:bifunctional riboflavin kinase/FAD synthetase [Thalassoglobus polymorphus]QDT32584.1 Riboflavin kinase [Thalassoglobus polymorphus]
MSTHLGLHDSPPYRDGYLSIGNFDGVHLGHRAILSKLVEKARAARTTSTVLTFDPHPIQLLRPEFLPPKLTTLEEKAELIQSCGVDHVVVYPTDHSLLELEPESFFKQIVLNHFQARGMVEGPNFYFGKNRAGTTETLQQLCFEHQMSLEIVSPTLLGELMVSSSEIRSNLKQGHVSLAASQLGRPYAISGVVIRGDERGRMLGFPTANLGEVETQIPKPGVYAAIARVGEKSWKAAINIGPNPTFGIVVQKIEAHLLDFEGDLYGQKICLDLIERVRDVKSFETVEELKQQVRKDIEQVQKMTK